MRRHRTRPFALVLAGGGARGYAHLGVLRSLQHMGLAPAGLVGVSMGAVVAATYALREDWYEALLSADLGGFPHPNPRQPSSQERPPAIRQVLDYAHTAWNMVTGWGAPSEMAEAGRAFLTELLGSKQLEEGRIPVIVCATDLGSGARIPFSSGPAAAAVYASSALAGILPPAVEGDRVLVDGTYADIAPVDLARSMGWPVVIAVDPGQVSGAGPITNGLQAVLRAVEICHHGHAYRRLREADLVLQPHFARVIDVLEFGARRECVAAGIEVVRARRYDIERTLVSGGLTRRRSRTLLRPTSSTFHTVGDDRASRS
ncbi:MAG: patatin-like phospholipase family protein [Longimicrobiales bacterium]